LEEAGRHDPVLLFQTPVMLRCASQNGGAPKTDAEKSAFKSHVSNMRIKADEENVDEAYAKAYTAYVPTTVPSDIRTLISADHLASVTPTSPIFDRLLAALKTFTDKHGVLLLTSSLPDMHSDTTNYIRLQTLYKMRANSEKAELRSYIVGEVDDAIVDAFVKNSHALRVLEGRKYGALDQDPELVGVFIFLHR
jgi:amyloid beta precursor protein binding protein 1